MGAASSSATFTPASLMGESAGAGWVLLGTVFFQLGGQGFLWMGHTAKDGIVREGDVTFHCLP